MILVPVKNLVNAKQRLAGVLSPEERRHFDSAAVEALLVGLRGRVLGQGHGNQSH